MEPEENEVKVAVTNMFHMFQRGQENMIKI